MAAREGSTFILVEEVGVCDGPVDAEAVKKETCHRYAALQLSPGQTADRMNENAVDVDDRPSQRALENRRHHLKSKRGGAQGRR